LTTCYHRACLVKRSWALLASNPARDNQVRAGRMIPRGPGGSPCRGQLVSPHLPHSFCPVIPPKTQACGSIKAVLVPVSRQPPPRGSCCVTACLETLAPDATSAPPDAASRRRRRSFSSWDFCGKLPTVRKAAQVAELRQEDHRRQQADAAKGRHLLDHRHIARLGRQGAYLLVQPLFFSLQEIELPNQACQRGSGVGPQRTAVRFRETAFQPATKRTRPALARCRSRTIWSAIFKSIVLSCRSQPIMITLRMASSSFDSSARSV